MDKLDNFQHAMDEHARSLQAHAGDLHSLQHPHHHQHHQAYPPPTSQGPGIPPGMHGSGRERDR
ncbi:hypothetical protein HK097_000262 [Rhizophlyctis rosea]|uniref:Uncharacterized protein n=1 Tax=Rhizophlyctis rosea TaxID=64517 RepID=A0AAD5WZL7_9FUNG|nr:hypothetical protein HK097_000262 [Rhizophlyctis rosea]